MNADRIYSLLLRAYPRLFRERFEAGMCDAFTQDYASARVAGRWATIAFWMRTIGEAALYGAAERLAPANRISFRSFLSKGRIMKAGVLHDCRDAFRGLRATPLVSLITILSLALGIGANTALFSILNGLVLKPLPVRDADALVLLDKGEWTNPIWEQIRVRQSQLFDGAFAWSNARFDLSGHGETDFAPGAYASGEIFDVLGVRAERGRLFAGADDARGGGPDGAVAVISDRFWKQRFGGAEDAVGRRLTLNGIPFTIIGVMPAGFFGPDVGRMSDVIVPLAGEAFIHGGESMLPGHLTWWLEIMARRKPGQSIEQADAALRSVQPQIRAATMPPSYRPSLRDYLREPFTLIPAAQGYSTLRGRYEQPLTIIMAVVSVVLLIACANIASLLLSRSIARRRELVIRLALGASRLRLARQLLIESMMLAFAGAAIGLVVARLGSAFLVAQLGTPASAVFLDLALDRRVLAFTAAVTVMTALFFGLAPAAGVSSTTPNEILKQQTRSIAGDRRWSVRNALVVVQVALSLALVVGAGLFVRTFMSLSSLPLGFNAAPLLAVDINVQRSQTLSSARVQLFERFREAAAATPGVADAALSRITPISGQGWNTVIEIAGAPPRSERERMSWVNAVSPRFFSTYGMTLIAGRDFAASDREGSPLVAIVNEAFARKFFNGGNPVGHEFRGQIGKPVPATYQIIGLVSDAVYGRLREGTVPALFLPLTQTSQGASIALTVRAAPGARSAIAPVLARALGNVDGTAALTIRPLDDYVGAAMTQERLVAMLSGFFGALALVLAALGLYGVTAYGVSRRRAEIGVRIALGAEPSGVVRLVLGRVGRLIGAGLVAGTGLSWWATRFISASLLYGVTPRDTATFAAAVSVLIAIGGIAGWLPARRAARIDPAQVLRET